MTITEEQLRDHLYPHIPRIAEQAARHEIRRLFAVSAFPFGSYRILVEECSQHVAERLLQHTNMAKMTHRYRPPVNRCSSDGMVRFAFGWARRIARNYLRDEVERHQRRHVSASPETIQRLLEGHLASGDPVAALISRETIYRVKLAMASLPENVRCAIELVSWEESSYADAAVQMGLSLEEVKYLLRKGRNQLRRTLAGD